MTKVFGHDQHFHTLFRKQEIILAGYPQQNDNALIYRVVIPSIFVYYTVQPS